MGVFFLRLSTRQPSSGRKKKAITVAWGADNLLCTRSMFPFPEFRLAK